MKTRFRKLGVESLEERSVLSTTAFADFNMDGLMDLAAITAPNAITVSLKNLDGSYTQSAILTAQKNQTITDIGAYDRDGDGDPDIYASSPAGGGWINYHFWSGNGDGTFGSRTTDKWSWPPKGKIGLW